MIYRVAHTAFAVDETGDEHHEHAVADDHAGQRSKPITAHDNKGAHELRFHNPKERHKILS